MIIWITACKITTLFWFDKEKIEEIQSEIVLSSQGALNYC